MFVLWAFCRFIRGRLGLSALLSFTLPSHALYVGELGSLLSSPVHVLSLKKVLTYQVALTAAVTRDRV